MTQRHLFEIPHDVRGRIAATIREHSIGLIEDIAGTMASSSAADATDWHALATVYVGLFASTTEAGGLDGRRGLLHDMCRVTDAMPTRQIVHSVHRAERIVLDELALDDGLGATSERWPLVAHAIRSCAFEIVAAYSERNGANPVRDQLTTLISPQVFRLALEQETARANRYDHPMSLLLFDIDNLSEVNKDQGYGAGDRLLERLGILARRFFRNHDWVARYGEDAIAVLLPETVLDQGAILAQRFREMVEQRLQLVDHKTDAVIRVTVSAAAVGTDHVQADIDGRYVLAEAEAAVLRAKMDGGNRTERLALLPVSVTIIGAASLLGVRAKDVVKLMRDGSLLAARRGRHYHIDRAQIEDYKRARDRQGQ